MSRVLRLGVIGCGNVLGAYRSAIDKLRLTGSVEVTLACGRESQRISARDWLKIDAFTTEAVDVLTSPDVDLVLILTSMTRHADLVRAALQQGKHVLVEKPLATSLEEADALVELAAGSTGLLLCAPFTTLSPTFQSMAARIRAGDIGTPCLARARYGWSGPWWNEWFYQSGGGCLLDLGVYCLTSLTGLLGPVRRVTAMTGVAIPERDIGGRRIRVTAEDNAQVLLDFGENIFGVVTTGFTMQQYRTPALEIYGTTGTIQMLGDDWDPEGYELWQNSAGCWQLFKETDPVWSWTDGLRHLVECIQLGRQPLVSPEHARHVLEIVLNAQRASRENKTLPIESRFALPVASASRSTEAVHLRHDRSREH